MDISDSRLLNLMQRGDTDALGVLYVRYSAQVRNFAMGFLQNEGDADDVTHDVFVNLWQQRDEISDIESLKAYLFTMTRNAIFSIFRHRRIAETYMAAAIYKSEEASSETEEKITTTDLLELVQLTIDSMPEQRRRIFTMNRFDHLTYDEIAGALGISRKTVEYHMSQALARLRKISRHIHLLL